MIKCHLCKGIAIYTCIHHWQIGRTFLLPLKIHISFKWSEILIVLNHGWYVTKLATGPTAMDREESLTEGGLMESGLQGKPRLSVRKRDKPLLEVKVATWWTEASKAGVFLAGDDNKVTMCRLSLLWSETDCSSECHLRNHSGYLGSGSGCG